VRSAARRQRLEPSVTGPWGKISAGNAERNLSFFAPGVEEYVAFLVASEKFGQRDILDGRGGRSHRLWLRRC
jgi:hypothetical protein